MELIQNIGIDLVTLVSLVAYIVRMEMKQKELVARREEDIKRLEGEIDKLEEHSNEKLIAVKHGKKALKEEVKEKLAELKHMNDTRFTNAHTRMEKIENNMTTQYNELSYKISSVESVVSKVDGKMDILIQKIK